MFSLQAKQKLRRKLLLKHPVAQGAQHALTARIYRISMYQRMPSIKRALRRITRQNKNKSCRAVCCRVVYERGMQCKGWFPTGKFENLRVAVAEAHENHVSAQFYFSRTLANFPRNYNLNLCPFFWIISPAATRCCGRLFSSCVKLMNSFSSFFKWAHN
jgi:hypothetical protein